MISNDEVRNLGVLARVALTPEEEIKLAGELGQILDYVGELKNANADGEVGLPGEALAKSGESYNKLREDANALASLEKGEFVKVKKIL